MLARVYVLLDMVHADSAEVARILRGKGGVAEIDMLEGPPDIIMIIEAPNRKKAAEYLTSILDSVDGMIENLHVLPVRKYSIKKSCREWEAGHKGRKLN